MTKDTVNQGKSAAKFVLTTAAGAIIGGLAYRAFDKWWSEKVEKKGKAEDAPAEDATSNPGMYPSPYGMGMPSPFFPPLPTFGGPPMMPVAGFAPMTPPPNPYYPQPFQGYPYAQPNPAPSMADDDDDDDDPLEREREEALKAYLSENDDDD